MGGGAVLAPFVDAVHDAFRTAGERAGIVERRYRVGGLPVVVRYAGDALARGFDRSLSPIADGTAGEPALELVAWDRASTGVPAPPPPWGNRDYLPRERIAGIDERELRVTYSAGHGLLSLHEPGATRAVLYAQDAAVVPHWVRRVPFRQLLGWWAGDHGMGFVHASAVGLDDRCVLLAGESGSGKSTTALACAEAGLGFLGDDLCLVALGPPPTAHAVYGVAKLEPDAARRLPALARRAVSVDAGQRLVEPRPLLTAARIAAVLLPRVTGTTRTTVSPASARDALFAVAPSTLVEPNGADAAALGRMATLVRSVPCHRLQLGTDLGDVVDAVRGVLDGRSP